MSSCGFNLIRNARMFFTTNVNTETGVVKSDGFTTTNTKEIQVLDGLSFSQNTTAETVTIKIDSQIAHDKRECSCSKGSYDDKG